MSRWSSLLALVPLLGVVELGLHQYFAARAPEAADYAALAPALSKLKRAGTPVVVTPAWAEPLVRQAAPGAFPLAELARPDDSGFAAFLEVSLLGQSAAELEAFPIEQQQTFGPFRLSLRRNTKPEPSRFDFVAAVERGEVEVWTEIDAHRAACELAQKPRPETGGLHGHVTYPERRFECDRGRFVGVTLIDDEKFRPRRCVLAQPPESGSVVLRFDAVPPSSRLVGFVGASYFLERDQREPGVELRVIEAEQELLRRSSAGADGWRRFEALRPARASAVEVWLSRLGRGGDFCFSLEAK